LLVFACAAIWSMPTDGPYSAIAATVASISYSRRAARCASHRELRPSGRPEAAPAAVSCITAGTLLFTLLKVADTVG
jgi:hypothetical protein